MFQISCSRAQPCSPPQSPGCPQALGTQAVPPSPQMPLLEAKAAAQRDPAPGHHKPRVGSEVAALLCFGPPPNCAISNCGVSEHSDCRKSRILVYVSEAVRVTFLFWHRGAPAPALTSPGAAPRGCSCSCSFLLTSPVPPTSIPKFQSSPCSPGTVPALPGEQGMAQELRHLHAGEASEHLKMYS